MANPKFMLLLYAAIQLFFALQVRCYQYKVGDLDAWGIPTSANPKVYHFWSKYHTIKIGDSLLFLYPPSQDSVIQVTEENYNACNLKDPILYMNNGNSLFNITKEGIYYFTSGSPGHCEKKQKLQIKVGNVTSSDSSAAYGPSGALSDTASAPSYPNVFGSIPLPPSFSPALYSFSVFFSALFGFIITALIM